MTKLIITSLFASSVCYLILDFIRVVAAAGCASLLVQKHF